MFYLPFIIFVKWSIQAQMLSTGVSLSFLFFSTRIFCRQRNWWTNSRSLSLMNSRRSSLGRICGETSHAGFWFENELFIFWNCCGEVGLLSGWACVDVFFWLDDQLEKPSFGQIQTRCLFSPGNSGFLPWIYESWFCDRRVFLEFRWICLCSCFFLFPWFCKSVL